MIEIKNKEKGCIQLPVKSLSKRREHSKALTVLNIPGRKTKLIPDEQAVEEYLERAKKWGQISYRYVPDSQVEQEEK